MEFEYEVKRSARAKRVRLAVKPDGRVTLMLPQRVSRRVGDQFVREHREWIIEKLKRYEGQGIPDQESRDRDYQENKELARERIVSRVDEWADRMGLEYNRIAIKKTVTRWGSCSSKKNLNFHYRLAFLDERLMDYVIVHELCHLVHMNHSKDFWQMVEVWCPEWRKYRRELRSISPMSVG